MGVNALFCFAVSIIGIILVVILLYKHNQPSARWLAAFLLTLAFANYFIYLFESRYMLSMPYFFRVGPLLLYLSAPALLFYVRYLMNEKRPLRWFDALHLIPALIYFIDFSPLYFSSNEFKRQLLVSLFDHKEQAIMFREGWFVPDGVHYLLRNIIGVGYVVYITSMFRNIKNHDVRKLLRNVQLRQWLRLILIHFFLYSVFGIVIWFFSTSVFSWLATAWISLVIFGGMSITLLFSPDILYGTHGFSLNGHSHKNKPSNNHEPFPAHVQGALRDFMEKRHYLNKNIKLKNVADELSVQPYILSAYINQVYQMRFNDLINWCRVQYIKDGLTKGQWNLLTLEAIAEEAGFSNRTTFLTAFKKFMGVTPTAFLHGERDEGELATGPTELMIK
jgi:AraC-like DNA-binding protein